MVGFVLVKSDDESDLTFTVIHNYVYEGCVLYLVCASCCKLLFAAVFDCSSVKQKLHPFIF